MGSSLVSRKSPIDPAILTKRWFGCTDAAEKFIKGIDYLSARCWVNGHRTISRRLDTLLRQWPVQQLASYATRVELPNGAIPGGELESLLWLNAQGLLRSLLGGRRPRLDEHLHWFVCEDHTTGGHLKLITRAVERLVQHQRQQQQRPVFDRLHDAELETRLLRNTHAWFTAGATPWLAWEQLLANATSRSWRTAGFGQDHKLMVAPSPDGTLTDPGRVLAELRLPEGVLMRLGMELPGEAFAAASANIAALAALAGRRDDDGHWAHLPEKFAQELAFTLIGRSSGRAADPSRVHRDVLGTLDRLTLGEPRRPGEPLRPGMIVRVREVGSVSTHTIGVIEHDGLEPGTAVVRSLEADGGSRVCAHDDVRELRQPQLVSPEPALV